MLNTFWPKLAFKRNTRSVEISVLSHNHHVSRVWKSLGRPHVHGSFRRYKAMWKAYTIRIYIIAGGHRVILFCTRVNVVSTMDGTLWRLFCAPKEASAGCVIGICSKVTSEFTYWPPFRNFPPNTKVLCLQSGCVPWRQNRVSGLARCLGVLWFFKFKDSFRGSKKFPSSFYFPLQYIILVKGPEHIRCNY